MPSRPQLHDFERELLGCSVSPEIVSRALAELQDHYDDLYEEALTAGRSANEASQQARARLGEPADIASAFMSHAELKRWSFRHPVAAACGRTLAMAAVVPAVPVIYCLNHGSDIVRWSASIGLALLVTSGLLLGLDSILLVR